MANGTDPTTLINGDGHPPLLDRDRETSPMYLALSSRLAKTESTLSSLSAQVSQLSQLVKAALPASPTAPTRPQHIFSPFDPPPPCSSFVPVSASSTFASAESDPAIAALTQQISALSTSVAQLQRLQQSQSKITRQNSTIQDDRTPGHIPHSVPMPRHLQDFVSGSMTTPNVAASFMSPGPIGSSRPNSNRSISSSVIRGNGDGGKWGSSNGNGWTSPGPGQGVNGGMMSRSGSGSGLNVSAPGGAATPGAGIVVTKWEHLNLSVELLRSIAKYGYVRVVRGLSSADGFGDRIGPPNKIQTRALPFMLKGSDIIAQAPPTQERIIS